MTRSGMNLTRPFAALMVQSGVFGLRHHLQVLWVAVKRVAVYVMDNLALDKPTPDLVLGGDGVVEHLAPARNVDKSPSLRDAKLIGNRPWGVTVPRSLGAGHCQTLAIGLCDTAQVVGVPASLDAKLDKLVSDTVAMHRNAIRYGLGGSSKINVFVPEPVGADK